VTAARPSVSERRACRVLGVARSALHAPPPRPQRERERDAERERRLAALIQRHPTFGYRRLWALLRRDGLTVNRKAVYRLLKHRGWLVHQRAATPRPRAQGRRSRAKASDERRAMDVTQVDCGADGWGHLAVVIDCHDREVIGWVFALRGRAQEAERTLEQACCRILDGSDPSAGIRVGRARRPMP
jgi:putative transposase